MSGALSASLTACHDCRLLCRLPAAREHAAPDLCPRCGALDHARKPRSLERTWAWWTAPALCYLPANLLSIMQVTSFGQAQADTHDSHR